MMNSPFTYGQIAQEFHFTNRESEQLRLTRNFRSKTNTVMISPRRWGKSSLVKYTAKKLVAENRKFRLCWFDMFNVHTEEEFYNEYSKAVIKATSGKMEEWIKDAGNYLAAISPQISLASLPDAEFDLSLKFPRKNKTYDTVMNLPEQVAISKKVTLVVCLDEFQNIEKFNNPLLFQQRLRAAWQHHAHVVYCVFGSKRHMMLELFGKRSMPFYKFGDLFNLGKIATEHWVPFVSNHFKKAGKKITKKQVEFITATVQEHPYYVQQLSEIVWYMADREVTEEVLKQAVNQLITTNQILFQRDYEQLSEMQVNLLRALAAGEKKLTSRDMLEEYRLGTSASVIKNMKALEKKGIIDTLEGGVMFVDPVFELWFKRLYRIWKTE